EAEVAEDGLELVERPGERVEAAGLRGRGDAAGEREVEVGALGGRAAVKGSLRALDGGLGVLLQRVERLAGAAALGGLDLGNAAEEGGDGAALAPERAYAERLDLVLGGEAGAGDLGLERGDLFVERGHGGGGRG